MAKAATKNPNALDGDIIVIRRGLAIYKINGSPFYQARIINPAKKPKYIVRSTKETNRLEARKIAEEIFSTTHGTVEIKSAAPADKTFEYYSKLAIKQAQVDVARGVRNPAYARNLEYNLYNKHYGLIPYLGHLDIRDIGVKHYADFSRAIIEKRSDISSSVHGSLRSAFRNVMKIAVYDGTIYQIPTPPKLNVGKSVARPFFRFRPMVPFEKDQYALIRRTAKKLADEKHEVRGIPITIELYCLIVFATNTFVRPTISELYALKHGDIVIQDNPKALSIVIAKGKTGYRTVISMPAAVNIYEMLRQHNSEYLADSDYLFLPKYKNRTTARNIMMRQFNYLLRAANLEQDEYTELKHSLYSLRHTAICMRMVLSHGSINLDILARNAGTSIQMLQDFYMKYLPITPEMARNLQSFGVRP